MATTLTNDLAIRGTVGPAREDKPDLDYDRVFHLLDLDAVIAEAAPDGPDAVSATILFGNTVASVCDWLFSGVLHRFPDLKLLFAESQIGWMPYLLERMDIVAAESAAGGVELDTLFIDEGFGSLDAETLDQVMTVIDELRHGGRVVGIVSHVADLKEQIAERLEIRRATLGQVNPLAREEYDAEKERLDDLRTQREDLEQKLFAAIRLTRLVWPQMKERKWGRIINVLNIGAKAPRGGSATLAYPLKSPDRYAIISNLQVRKGRP